MRVRLAAGWTRPEPPQRLVARISVPLAIVHGTDDRFIAVRDAAQLWEATPEPRRLTVVRGMGHAFEPIGIEPIADAVEWALAHELSATS
jgi:alpha-beta hydrolase superfamily lysophospholipase